MIIYKTAFVNTNDADYPDTEAVDETVAGARDGTELIAALVNDLWLRFQAVQWHAGGLANAPNGFIEGLYDDGDSQFMESLAKGYQIGTGNIVLYAKNQDPALVTPIPDRVLILEGQGILRTNYPLLDNVVYVGDSLNATASTFYHADDPGGTIRNTVGVYLILPDARGQFIRSLDPTGSVDPEGASRDIGSIQFSRNEDHQHYAGIADDQTFSHVYGSTANDMPGLATWRQVTTGGGTDFQPKTSFQSATATPATSETRSINMTFKLGIVY